VSCREWEKKEVEQQLIMKKIEAVCYPTSKKMIFENDLYFYSDPMNE
jgi:hypothetical protein